MKPFKNFKDGDDAQNKFEQAALYVLRKNADMYRRLSKFDSKSI